jgi:hypothetical protein
MTEPRSYRQTLVVARIGRAGGVVKQSELLEFAGDYSHNIIAALISRDLIQSPGAQVWELTPNGRAIAAELLGKPLPHPNANRRRKPAEART